MKIITRDGLSTYFFGIEVAGTIAWFATAVFLFIAMWVATQDLFASLFFPIEMIVLYIGMIIYDIIKYYIKK